MKKIIIITGASSGIGLATATVLSQQKDTVVYGLSRNIVNDSSFYSLSCDITNFDEVYDKINSIIKKEKRIDVLINNAGRGMIGPIEDASEEEVDNLFGLNLKGALKTIQAVLPIFKQQGFGKIINISSIGSIMGLPFRGFYSASKAALDKVTEALRYELKPWNIQCTLVHLGDVSTKIADNRINTYISDEYKSVFNKVQNNMNSHVDSGVSANSVGIFLQGLVAKKRLKAHYYFADFSQKKAKIIHNLIPYGWFEKIIAKYSGL